MMSASCEVSQAVTGTIGQNPRKRITHTWDDVTAELCDAILSAIVTLTTLTPDAPNGLRRTPGPHRGALQSGTGQPCISANPAGDDEASQSHEWKHSRPLVQQGVATRGTERAEHADRGARFTAIRGVELLGLVWFSRLLLTKLGRSAPLRKSRSAARDRPHSSVSRWYAHQSG
jgi:hypothetical protein